MRTLDLNGDYWTVRTLSAEAPENLRGRAFPAIVPGCVHTDLVRAGVIPDPLIGTNERDAQWIGECDWEYTAKVVFDGDALNPDDDRGMIELVCEGLDTLATVEVNGRVVGHAANMFTPHRFDLRGVFRPGENSFRVVFASPLRHIRAERDRLGARPVNGDWDPYIFIRKQASSFGWDWAPKLPTSGIWKPMRIEFNEGARIAAIRPRTTRLDGSRWLLEVDVDFEWLEGATFRSLRLSGDLNFPKVHGQLANDVPVQPGQRSARVSFEVSDPAIWWPRGYGDQPLHLLRVFLDDFVGGNGNGISQRQAHVGFREAALITEGDDHGTPFTVVVNGRPIFCQGANWIPEGPYAAAAGPEQVAARVGQAASMGMNMLRVWGGGYYESDAFYETCDQLGILVWQDFMFACAMYPEESPYPSLIEAEARHQVARLAKHPCVVLWCGGNECTWAHEAWGHAPGERPWIERLQGRTWGAEYYHDLLPRVVEALDPTCSYWPNSPWPGGDGLGGNHADHGDRHTWDLRLDGYTSIIPRFVSEFGHQAPAARETLLTAVDPKDLRLGSPALEHRQRATGGTERHINEAIREHFGRDARDFDEWLSMAQLLQARGVYTGFAWARVNRGRCMGALVWQLNDCWPGMSWSLIDACGVEKPAAAAARHALRPRQLFILNVDGSPHLYGVNDTDEAWHAPMTVTRASFAGDALAEVELRTSVPARAAQSFGRLHDLVGPPLRPSGELCAAECGACRATAFYVKDKDLELPAPQSELDQVIRRHSLRTSD